MLDGQGIYRIVRDHGWEIERIPRMKGMSIHITSPDYPGMFAGAFGYYGVVPGDKDGEMAAWEELAQDWDEHDFWRKEPE